jgi:PPM family protein phosphatase
LATAVVRYTAAAQTDRGRKRPSNEDAFGFSVEHGIYIVCDGMGGAAAGEVASSIAVDEVLRHLTARREAGSSLPELAEKAISAANQAIFSRAQRNRKLNGMGTTLVALVVEEQHVWVLNVGDSRCYRLRSGRLEQLTLDHSLVEEQVRLGRMSHSEALRSPLRNIITRALGTQEFVTPDCFQFEAEPGDVFVLCSDGLTRELTDKTIESILTSSAASNGSPRNGSSLQDRCAQLVEAARKAGGHDNITSVLVQASGY